MPTYILTRAMNSYMMKHEAYILIDGESIITLHCNESEVRTSEGPENSRNGVSRVMGLRSKLIDGLATTSQSGQPGAPCEQMASSSMRAFPQTSATCPSWHPLGTPGLH